MAGYIPDISSPSSEYECGTCGREFSSGWRALDQHCEATGHDAEPEIYECDRCDRIFSDEESRQQHEADVHYLCADCDRSFNSPQAVRQHLEQSSIHRDSNVLDPLSQKAYTAAAGVTQYVKSGSYPQTPRNMNQETPFGFVRAHDPKGAVSKKPMVWQSENKYEATDWAWNGSGYECFYFCHKSFSTLQALNQHLASPVHFKILGSLVNHLESEQCGAMKYDKVQAGVENLIHGVRLLM
ncbi:hypothetical protein N0V82_008923 [Gnomoniopsis sp. IMI 355080]|nr:hypothetical protein N0V82_008923 [Gnomoniopsis sp. IMI 355080]